MLFRKFNEKYLSTAITQSYLLEPFILFCHISFKNLFVDLLYIVFQFFFNLRLKLIRMHVILYGVIHIVYLNSNNNVQKC